MPSLNIRVNIYMTLREKLGWNTRIVELKSGENRLSNLLEKLPRLAEELEAYREKGYEPVILVNGRHHVFLGGLDAVLSDGDVVDVFPPAAGG